MNAVRAFLAVLLVAIGATLHGCGCDKDKAESCVKALTTSSTMCKDMSNCYKDSSCCDYEEDGKTIKDVVAGMCTTLGTPGDNQCA